MAVVHKTRRCRRKGILLALFAFSSWMVLSVCLQLRYLLLVVGQQQQMKYSIPATISALANFTLFSPEIHSANPPAGVNNSAARKRYAYAFYATTTGYACSAFVNIAALSDSGTPSNIDFVLLTYGQSSEDPGVSEQATKMNVKLKKVEHLKNFEGSNSYYTNVMVKLRVFQLFEYDRVIYMDSDMMVRKNLDHLFSLPEDVHLAASRVTNQKNTDPQRFCSCFMVIKPTPKIWERIMGYYDSDDGYVKDNLYDMDLLNKEFRSDVTLLPGTYGALTSIWDNATNANHHEQIRGWYQQILGEASNVTTRHELFDASQVLHFTPNKPMVERTLTHIKRNRPDADPRYFATFERWFSLSSYVCPFDKYKSLHRYDKHKWSKYQGSHQYSDYFV